jgi:hypothetical protein
MLHCEAIRRICWLRGFGIIANWKVKAPAAAVRIDGHPERARTKDAAIRTGEW